MASSRTDRSRSTGAPIGEQGDALGAAFRAELTREVTTAVTSSVCSTVERLLTAQQHQLETMVTGKISPIEKKLDTIEDRLHHLETEQADSSLAGRAASAQISHELHAISESNSGGKIPGGEKQGGFFRDPDNTVVRISAKEFFTKEMARSLFPKICENSDVEVSKLSIDGPAMSKFFVVRLEGDDRIAAARVSKIMGAMRIDANTFKRFEGKDPDGRPIDISVNRDKSPATSRKEVLTKRLEQIFKDLYPGLPIVANKREGLLSCKWVPLARVNVKSQSEAQVQLVQRRLAELSIDKQQVLAAFASVAGTVAEDEWCS